MKFMNYLAAVFVSCLVVSGVFVSSASADPPQVLDVLSWAGDEPTQTDLSGIEYGVTGLGDYVKHEECDSALFTSCDLFPGAIPIVSIPKTGSYPVGSKAEWTYTVPGGPDTYIKHAGAVVVNVTGETEETAEIGEPTAYAGIWNGTGWSAYESTNESTVLELNTISPAIEGTPDDRQIKAGVEAKAAVSNAEDHWAGLAVVGAVLGDDVEPIQEIDPGDVPSGWIDGTPFDIPVHAEDNGLGVQKLVAVGPKRNPASLFDFYWVIDDFGCEGTTDDPCPLETEPGTKLTIEPLQMKEGNVSISIGAYDAMENLANNDLGETFNMRIDTKAPTATFTGSFTTAPGMVLDGPLYTLRTEAADGNSTVANSGVTKIEVLIDGVVADSRTRNCANQNCSLSLDSYIEPDEYANGSHVLKVKATDAVGHVKTETYEFEVDR